MLRFSSLGDIILATHLPRLIKKSVPNESIIRKVKIDFVTTSDFQDVISKNPYIDNVHIYDKNWSHDEIKTFKSRLRELNGGRYDLVVDLQKNFRSLEFRYGMGKTIRAIRKRYLHKFLLVNLHKSFFSKKAIPQIYFDSLKGLGIKDDLRGLEIWTDRDKNVGQYLPFDPTYVRAVKSGIVIAPGAKHFTKRWPQDRYEELISYLLRTFNTEISLIGSADEAALCNSIKNNYLNESRVKNYAGASSLLESVTIIDKSALAICNDSAVMHIAAARKTPVVAIFGSTTREFGFEPYGTKFTIAEVKLSCRPCTHYGRTTCPKGHFNCMKLITAEDVYNIAAHFLRDK